MVYEIIIATLGGVEVQRHTNIIPFLCNYQAIVAVAHPKTTMVTTNIYPVGGRN